MFGTKTIVFAVTLLVGALAFWMGRPAAIPTAASVVQASFLELHRNAHLDNLPVQEMNDQTVVFSSAEHQ
jgi:hypothetical protein